MKLSTPAIAGRPMDGGLVDVGRAQGDVVLDRTEEQAAILQHAADVAAQVGGIDLPDVGAVDQDRAIRPARRGP